MNDLTFERRRKHSERAAFTLMEVLLVLVILVALGAVAVNVFTGTKRRADENIARTQINQFMSACDRYNLDMGEFPPDLMSLRQPPGGYEPYIAKDPPLDPWDNPYMYQYPGRVGGNEKPDIWSWGYDRRDGTDDDIGSWQ